MTKAFTFFLLLLLFASPTQAQTGTSAADQLRQYVADLQKSPDDQALREKIIKLALTLDPKPATPEEAERFMARGQAALEIGKESRSYAESITEFQKAALAAPWLGNIYYNLGYVQEKAGDYNAALRNLKLYLLATPNASDEKAVKALIYKIEYKQEQAAKEADVAAERDRQKGDGLKLLRSLVEGKRYAWYECRSPEDGSQGCKWKHYYGNNWVKAEKSPTLRHWEFRGDAAYLIGNDGSEIYRVRSSGPNLNDLNWERRALWGVEDTQIQWYAAPFVDFRQDFSQFTIAFGVRSKDEPSSNADRVIVYFMYKAQ